MSWSGTGPSASARTFNGTTIGASSRTFSGATATDLSRQFLGIGPIGDVDFVLTVDEDRILYLSELQPYVLVQEVMETP